MRRSLPVLAAVAVAVVATSTSGTASADPVTVRDVVTYSALGLGAVAIAVGIGETAHATSLDSQDTDDRRQVPVTVTNVCNAQDNAAAAAACKAQNDSSSAWTAAWVAYGTGLALAATGVVLLLTKPHATTTTGQVDVTPAVTPRTAGLQLRIAF
jgi:hypothetical protein